MVPGTEGTFRMSIISTLPPALQGAPLKQRHLGEVPKLCTIPTPWRIPTGNSPNNPYLPTDTKTRTEEI